MTVTLTSILDYYNRPGMLSLRYRCWEFESGVLPSCASSGLGFIVLFITKKPYLCIRK
jgi:hypothetical protein